MRGCVYGGGGGGGGRLLYIFIGKGISVILLFCGRIFVNLLISLGCCLEVPPSQNVSFYTKML